VKVDFNNLRQSAHVTRRPMDKSQASRLSFH